MVSYDLLVSLRSTTGGEFPLSEVYMGEYKGTIASYAGSLSRVAWCNSKSAHAKRHGFMGLLALGLDIAGSRLGITGLQAFWVKGLLRAFVIVL